jgi:hypothetical protein
MEERAYYTRLDGTVPIDKGEAGISGISSNYSDEGPTGLLCSIPLERTTPDSHSAAVPIIAVGRGDVQKRHHPPTTTFKRRTSGLQLDTMLHLYVPVIDSDA